MAEIYNIEKINKFREKLVYDHNRDFEPEHLKPKINKKLMAELYKADVFSYNIEDRMTVVGDIFVSLKYRSATAKKYLRIMQKRGMFGAEAKRINTLYFDQKFPPQQRVPNMFEFDKMMDLVDGLVAQARTTKESLSLFPEKPENFVDQRNSVEIKDEIIAAHRLSMRIRKALAIRLAMLTGLRLAEIIRLKTRNLMDLITRQNSTILHRKTSEEWDIYYYDALNLLIETMSIYFHASLELHQNHGVESYLFTFTGRTLQHEVRHLYRLANKKEASVGFGMHTFKYVLATKIAATGDIETARRMMNHKHLNTTKKYVKYSAMRTARVFSELAEKPGYFKDLVEIF